ncbi:MAG TPA: hypothetical protein VHL53_18670 [Acidimicrobiia bacterium]|nr:hypothetical protein [Acidimicrobiia bacterium]
MRRRWVVTLGVLAGLLAGCHHGPPDRAAPSTTRPSGPTTSTSAPKPGAGAGVLDAWFSTEQNGWVVADAPCPHPPVGAAACPVVSKTTDGGGRWETLSPIDVGSLDEVSDVRFADPQHGWAFNRSLYATFNGGKRWQLVDLGSPVVALEVAGNAAYALVGNCTTSGSDGCSEPMRLAEGAVATGRWRYASLPVELPRTDRGSLVADRSGVYALVTATDGMEFFLARTSSGRWERRTPPCPGAMVGPIVGGDGLVAACPRAGSGQSIELQTSSDGGRSWAVVWQFDFPSPLVSLVVTGEASVATLDDGDVLRSTDNGRHFGAVLHAGDHPEVAFSDATHGIVTAGLPGHRAIFRTADTGETWTGVDTPGEGP